MDGHLSITGWDKDRLGKVKESESKYGPRKHNRHQTKMHNLHKKTKDSGFAIFVENLPTFFMLLEVWNLKKQDYLVWCKLIWTGWLEKSKIIHNRVQETFKINEFSFHYAAALNVKSADSCDVCSDRPLNFNETCCLLCS